MEIENQMITLDKINKAWGFDINHYPKDNLTFVHAWRDIDAEFADEVVHYCGVDYKAIDNELPRCWVIRW
jgi:hypothetical protein